MNVVGDYVVVGVDYVRREFTNFFLQQWSSCIDIDRFQIASIFVASGFPYNKSQNRSIALGIFVI